MSCKVNFFDTSTIRGMEVQAPTAYSTKRHVVLRFEPNPGPESLWGVTESMHAHMRGFETSPIAFTQAKEMAETMSRDLGIPVKVVKVFMHTGQNRDDYLEKDAHGKLHPKQGLSEKDVWVAKALKIKEVDRFRDVIRHCQDKGYISVEERAQLSPFIQEVEKQLGQAKEITADLSVAQRDIINTFCEPYIDPIMDAVEKCPDTITLLGKASGWLTLDLMPEKRELALALLMESMQGHPATIYLEWVNGLDEEMSSADVLKLVYEGSSQLESALRQNGNGIPQIAVQREAVLKFIEERLTLKYGPEKDPQIEGYSLEFLQKLRAKLFAQGYRLNTMKGYQKLEVRPFGAAVERLRGDFADEFGNPKHHWLGQNGKWLSQEQIRGRFAAINAAVMKEEIAEIRAEISEIRAQVDKIK